MNIKNTIEIISIQSEKINPGVMDCIIFIIQFLSIVNQISLLINYEYL